MPNFDCARILRDCLGFSIVAPSESVAQWRAFDYIVSDAFPTNPQFWKVNGCFSLSVDIEAGDIFDACEDYVLENSNYSRLVARSILRIIFSSHGITFDMDELNQKGFRGDCLAYPARRDRFTGRPRQNMRLGRIFRRYLQASPSADSFVEGLIARLAERFPADGVESLHVVIGTDRAAFRRAYTAPHVTDEYCGRFGGYFSSLPGSCMQGFKDSPWRSVHPAEAYASGDFVMVAIYATSAPDSPIGARVVVAHNGVSAAPVYAVSGRYAEAARRAVLAHFDSDLDDMTESFTGYSMELIERPDGHYAMPYLDSRETVSPTSGEIDGYDGVETDTSGYITSEPQGYCDHCEDYTDEDDLTMVGDSAICNYCFSQHYFTCANTGEHYHDDEAIEVYVRRGNTYHSQTWGPGAVENDAVYSEHHGEYYALSDVVYVETAEDYVEIGETEEFEGEIYIIDSPELHAARREFELGMTSSYCDDPRQIELEFESA